MAIRTRGSIASCSPRAKSASLVEMLTRHLTMNGCLTKPSLRRFPQVIRSRHPLQGRARRKRPTAALAAAGQSSSTPGQSTQRATSSDFPANLWGTIQADGRNCSPFEPPRLESTAQPWHAHPHRARQTRSWRDRCQRSKWSWTSPSEQVDEICNPIVALVALRR